MSEILIDCLEIIYLRLLCVRIASVQPVGEMMLARGCQLTCRNARPVAFSSSILQIISVTAASAVDATSRACPPVKHSVYVPVFVDGGAIQSSKGPAFRHRLLETPEYPLVRSMCDINILLRVVIDDAGLRLPAMNALNFPLWVWMD